MPRVWAWHSGHSAPACHLSHSGQPPSRNSTDHCTEFRSLLPRAFMSLLHSVLSPLLLSLQESPQQGFRRHLCVHTLVTNTPKWLIQHHPIAFQSTASQVYRARKLTRTPLQLESSSGCARARQERQHQEAAATGWVRHSVQQPWPVVWCSALVSQVLGQK